jgi:hypothetical protein
MSVGHIQDAGTHAMADDCYEVRCAVTALGRASWSDVYPNMMSTVVPLSEMRRLSPAGNSTVICRYGNA